MLMLLVFFTALLIWLSANRRYKSLYIACKTLPRDIRIAIFYIKVFSYARNIFNTKICLAEVFHSLVKKHPQKIAFRFEEEKWTYLEVEEFSYKISTYFMNLGFAKGDTVALLLDNCPEYPCIYLGLSRIGVITALINTNLMKDPLLHSISVVHPKAVIFGSGHVKAIKEISANLETSKLFQLNRSDDKCEVLFGSTDLRVELCDVNSKHFDTTGYKADPKDPLIYIYTSGTTGLPKASVLTQLRFILAAKTFSLIGDCTPDDVVYTPLPLYHTAGGILGIGQTLITGSQVVIRKKFSATNYFTDCKKYNVTVAQYIGEMCRYMLASATTQNDPQTQSLKVMVGNGLKPQIWNKFVKKFSIKRIVELYGSTEGVSNFVNLDNKMGSVGCIPWFLKRKFPVSLLKYDESGEPIRDSSGKCIKCGVNEPGVVVGKIDPKLAVLNFDGYTDKSATEKKILHGVFKEGDMYFNSGDILVCDEYNYYYFKDRIGDTFRWKGENVSTTEVEAVISNLVQLADVTVYGVEIPNTDGRAGMAAITDPNGTLNMESLGIALQKNLPNYAIPIFIRVLDSVPLTGTFKLKKIELRDEGYDVDKVQDKLYFFDSIMKKYVNLSKALYENINRGALKI